MNKKRKKKGIGQRVIKFLVRTFIVLLLFFVTLVLVIRSPWGQEKIINEVTKYVSQQTGTKFSIKKFFLTFDGNLNIQQLYLEDLSEETLLAFDELELSIPLMAIFKQKEIKINYIYIDGLESTVYRKIDEDFNYQFLIDAFTSGEENEEESESEFEFLLQKIQLKNTQLSYKDEPEGLDSEVYFGDLMIRINTFDLVNLQFKIDEFFLGNSDVKFTQQFIEKENKELKEESFEESQLPTLEINSSQVSELASEIQFMEDDYSAFIKDLNWNEIQLKLNEKQIFWKDFILEDARIAIEAASLNKPQDVDQSKEESIFEWPDWELAFENLYIKNQQFSQITKGESLSKKAFDANNFQFNQLHLELTKTSYAPTEKKLKSQLKQLKFEEYTGLSMKDAKFQLQVSEEGIQVEQIRFNALENQLRGDFAIAFFQLNQFINQPESFTYFDLNLEGFFQLKEFQKLIPNFNKNEPLVQLAKHPIQTKIEMNGDAKKLKIKPSYVHWSDTKINLSGRIDEALSKQQLIHLNNYQIQTNKKDVLVWLDEETVKNFKFPNQIDLQGNIQNKSNLWTTKSRLKTDLGQLSLAGKVNLEEEITFDLKTDIQDLQIDEILQNEHLSALSLSLDAKGKYKDIERINLDFSTEIKKFDFNTYSIDGLQVTTQIENSKGDLAVSFKDDNIDIKLNSPLELADNFYVFEPELVVNGIDFYQMGLLNEDIKARFTIQSIFKGNPEEFDLKLSIPEFVSVYEQTSYQLKGFDLAAQIGPEITNLSTQSKFLNTQLKANKHPSDLVDASWKYIQKYITEFAPEEEEVETSKIDLEWDLQMVNVPLLSEVFLEDLQEMDTLKLSFDFKEEKNEIRANVSLPHIRYKDIELNKLFMEANANPIKADFNVGFDYLESGGFQLAKSKFSGAYEDDFWKLTLEAFQEEEPFFYIRSFIEKEDEKWVYSLDDELILNSQEWNVNPNNNIQFGNKSLAFNDFEIERKQQKLAIRNDLSIEHEHFGLLFNNFKLGTFTSYLHPEALFASGEINGELVVVKPFEQIGFLADLSIEDLAIKEKEIGKLALNASADGTNTYATEMSLKGDKIDFFAKGKYFYQNEEPNLDVQAQLKQLDLSLIERFIPDVIEDSEGIISSNFILEGPTNQLTYQGDISMKEVGFNAKAVNTKFYFGDEKIRFNEKEIEFKKFTIADVQKNQFITSGKIYLDPITNPKFDLNFKADSFQLLDADRDESTAYYGKVNFDLNAQLTGNLNIPILDVDFKLNKSTDFTLVIPESQADVVEREGVVLFVNKSDPDAILTRTTEQEFNQLIKGFEIDAKIKVSPRAKITVIFNQRTGDKIQLQGEADLLASVEPNGNIDLSGNYEVNEGFFEINLYNLVTRKFTLAQGSKVSWYGDPYNADIDLRAVYKVDTSPSALMASQIASEANAVQNRYRRQLPFLVYLDVEGSLNSPYLSFALDMPEEQRSAINGTVYSRINQLNQQEDELNKQVFSLLVLNRFYPESGSDGSQGGAAALARNNLNQALADQLNTFSNKLTGNTGIELNFDINSYTDFETGVGQERTDVDVSAQKKLFNDRLVVEAGSQVNVQGDQRPGESNVALGNVSVEYLITEDGRWKARGFRKSEYENVIDGQVFISGIALIFTREFNQFEELWKSLFATSKKLEELEKEEEEIEEMEQKQEEENGENSSKQPARLENEQ